MESAVFYYLEENFKNLARYLFQSEFGAKNYGANLTRYSNPRIGFRNSVQSNVGILTNGVSVLLSIVYNYILVSNIFLNNNPLINIV